MDIRTLQNGLNSLGFDCGKADGIYGKKTKAAVEDFQESRGLYDDGIFGKQTLKEYNICVSSEYKLVEIVADKDAVKLDPVKVVTVKCDKYKDGFSEMRMRQDVATSFNLVRSEVNELGGIVTSGGCGRDLAAGGGKSQSILSMHYAFLAFDLALSSGMQSLEDPFLITDDGDGYWRVYVRCKSAPIITIKAVVAKQYNGYVKTTEHEITGSFADFTEIAERHGFKRIRRRQSFKKRYSSAEWWHFQHEASLQRGVSTFGSELLRFYSEETIKKRYKGDWSTAKHAVFGIEWR